MQLIALGIVVVHLILYILERSPRKGVAVLIKGSFTWPIRTGQRQDSMYGLQVDVIRYG